MAQDSEKLPNTGYGVFWQACWYQHKRQYPEELIHKEIEEFNKQCSVWWRNLSEQERERFQEMADTSNATQASNTSLASKTMVCHPKVPSLRSSGEWDTMPELGTSVSFKVNGNDISGRFTSKLLLFE